jgi:5-methylcytosine-specific restriction endonuclease McrA
MTGARRRRFARVCVCGRVDGQRHQGSSGWAKYAAKFPERAAFYQSGPWKIARDEQLRREPNCRVCGQPAKFADHIINRAEGGADLDPANLQSMCREHHRTKTLAESHRGMKRAAAERRRRRGRS